MLHFEGGAILQLFADVLLRAERADERREVEARIGFLQIVQRSADYSVEDGFAKFPGCVPARHLMKNRLDGPEADDFVKVVTTSGGDVRFQPSPLAVKVQLEYAKFYGTSHQGERSSLPRRIVPKEPANSGEKGLKRKRVEECQALLQKAGHESVVPEAAQRLEQVAEEAAAKRLCKSHAQLRERLQNYAKKRRELTEMDAAGPGHPVQVAKLKQLQKEAEQQLEKSQDLTVSILDASKPGLPFGTLVLASSNEEEEKLNELGALTYVVSGSTDTLLECMRAGLEAPYVIWYAATPEAEKMLVFGEDLSIFSASARILGGGCAGPSWLQASSAAGKLLPPVLQLDRAFDRPLRLCLHKSLEDCDSQSARAICLVLKACEQLHRPLRWIMFKKWKHVPGA